MANKTRPHSGSVDDFLSAVEPQERRDDCRKLVELMQQITKEPPAMWGPSIVGFGTYHYKYASGREGDWFLTGFSPRKQNLSLYMAPGLEDFEDLTAELGKCKTGKGCVYIKTLEDVKLPILKKLIRHSVKELRKRDAS